MRRHQTFVSTNCILLLILRPYPWIVFRKLLEFATKKRRFPFDRYNDQIESVDGLPLGSVLTNIFVNDFEEKWLMNAKICPLFWNRYLDDILTMFHNIDSAFEFLNCFQLSQQ